MKIVILFHRLGPYHHARLNALAAITNLTVIELCSVDNTYAWDKVNSNVNFAHITLFSNEDIDTVKHGKVKDKLDTILGTISPDVIAIPGWASIPALLTLRWSLQNNIPTIVLSASTEMDEVRFTWQEAIKSKVVKLFSAALGGGKPHLEYLNKLGLKKDSLFVGYDVVDNDYFTEGKYQVMKNLAHYQGLYNLPKRYFVNSSRFIPKKNLFGLIDAYKIYQNKIGLDSWQLIILGDGPLRNDIAAHISKLGLDNWVHLPGFIQYPQLPIYYGAAKVYIQSSTTEQWGLVVNEAMASGLPVLVSNRCGCSTDLILEGKNGFTFDPFDINGLSDLMIKIASDETILATMSAASMEIISRWTPNTFATNLLKAAHSAIDSKPPKFSWVQRILLWALIRR